MKAIAWVMGLAACVVPPQQSGYQQQPGYAQQQPGYPPQQGASCQDTMQCYGQCNPMTPDCVGVCDQRATPDTQQQAHAVLQCMAQSGCQDQSCVMQACNAQLAACTNGAIAAAPQQHAGFRSASIAETWVVDGRGGFDEQVKVATINGGAPQGSAQHNIGSIAIDNNVVTIQRAANGNIPAYAESFIVSGWYVGPDVIMMKLQGPFRRAITQADFQNMQSNSYLDHVYVKPR